MPVEDGPHTARALTWLGCIDALQGSFSVALNHLEQAIEQWHAIGDRPHSLEASDQLGWALYRAGESSKALEVFEANLELARSLAHDLLVRAALLGVCQVLLVTGQFERAEPLAQELQHDHLLADCAQHRGDYAVAKRYRLRALESALEVGDESTQAIEIFGLAMIAGGMRRDEDAVRLEGAVEAKWEELGMVARPRVLETWRERDLGAARARLGKPRATAAFEEGRAMTWDQVVEIALGKTQDV